MNLLQLFQSRSKLFYLLLFLSGLANSLTNIGIIMFVNAAVGGKSLPFLPGEPYLVFIVMIVFSFITSILFQNYLVVINNNILYELELSIVQKIRNATFESFEKTGSERIYGAISDARVLSRVPETLITLVNAFVTVLCTLLYLFYVSIIGGIAILVLMVTLLIIYLYRNKIVVKHLNRVRDLQDEYYESLRELLDGFKQVRISAARNNNLFNKYIVRNRNNARSLNILASKKFVVNELVGVYSWYIVLGVVIFGLPLITGIGQGAVAGFVTTVLFMIAPVSQLIMFFPFYSGIQIATQRIIKLNNELESCEIQPISETQSGEFSSIRFENLTYQYKDADNNILFEMPPLNIEIPKGQVVFVTGGNGSGKTTFINLLTGLYKPAGGQIFINGREVPWVEFASYANNIASIYTNHHLFKNNYDEHDLSENNPAMKNFISMLNLDGILRIDEERDVVDTRLSKGQQKRLALLLALLENKPILVLDEWAAEQDPVNRRSFYTRWIQKFREMGKTILIVSHDDDFYYKADRVIKFNFGKIISDTLQVQEPVQ